MIELAHGVGRVFESPIPTWLYGVAAALAVAGSFVVRALAPEVRDARPERRIAGPSFARAAVLFLKGLGVVGLLVTLLAGIISEESGFTLATLLFWVGLVVGGVLLSAIVDGVWRFADPWATLEGVYRVEGAKPSDRHPPWWLGPLLLYLLFWFELISGQGFDATYVVGFVALYSVFAFTARPFFGRYWPLVDPLSILFGFAARSAPLRLDEDGLYRRSPVTELDREEAMPLSLYASVFILLASTTLDNVRETVGWSDLRRSLGLDSVSHELLDSVALLAFAFLFFAPFLLAIWVAKSSLRSELTLSELSRRFGWSLIPIGTAYVLAHNIPLFISAIPDLIQGISDPFDKGWNIFGTADAFEDFFASPRVVWVLEILAIVIGHILGVLAAHRIAVRLSDTSGRAVRSQIALTVLMSVFTITTLWLLAQPLVT